MNPQNQEASDTIQGTIEKILFQDKESGFTIFVLATPQQKNITAMGTVATMAPGQEVTVTGSWRMHKKFGKQFAVTQCSQLLPTSIEGLKKYLGSGLIKGIGSVYAHKLVDYFGPQVLTIIDEQPERLSMVPGIGEKRVEQIVHAWKDQKEIAALMVFLQDKGVSTAYAIKIYKQYKDRALAIVQENPYRLADEIWGIGFKIADDIAQKIGISPTAPQRLRAAILFSLSQAAKQGHLYIRQELLLEQTAKLLLIEGQQLTDALQLLLHNQHIVAHMHETVTYFTLASHYAAEQGVAHLLTNLNKTPKAHNFLEADIVSQLVQPHSAPDAVLLNSDQQNGILACLRNKVTIITGGPGTGKTTLIKQLLTLLDHQEISYKLAAPTGRAAKRMAESSGRYATTIHRLLEFDMSSMKFKYNEQHTLTTHFLIVDEASMIDIFLAHALLKAIPRDAHLILLGDIHQLPSVGPGNFLNDCIASGQIATVTLTEIFRQARNSLIVMNAHRMNEGKFPVSSTDPLPDFLFIQEDNPEQIEQHIYNVLRSQLPPRHIDPRDAMVLCPMNRGGTGTMAVNQLLQKFFNPEKQDSISYAGITYKVYDKIMQLRNNYDKLIFNGDIGILTLVHHEESYFEVSFDERIVRYEFDEINEITLAYAITIHKSQGSEYPAIIIPLFTQHFTMLQRNLVYTAVTRARKLCVFIGQTKALAIAIKNNKGVARATFLTTWLQKYA